MRGPPGAAMPVCACQCDQKVITTTLKTCPVKDGPDSTESESAPTGLLGAFLFLKGPSEQEFLHGNQIHAHTHRPDYRIFASERHHQWRRDESQAQKYGLRPVTLDFEARDGVTERRFGGEMALIDGPQAKKHFVWHPRKC